MRVYKNDRKGRDRIDIFIIKKYKVFLYKRIIYKGTTYELDNL